MRKPWEFESPACAEVGVDMFFLPDKDEPRPIDGKQLYPPQLRSICGGCRHLRECGEWALKYEDHGFWAGMTAHDREDVRRARRIPLHNISASRQNQTKVAKSA